MSSRNPCVNGQREEQKRVMQMSIRRDFAEYLYPDQGENLDEMEIFLKNTTKWASSSRNGTSEEFCACQKPYFQTCPQERFLTRLKVIFSLDMPFLYHLHQEFSDLCSSSLEVFSST